MHHRYPPHIGRRECDDVEFDPEKAHAADTPGALLLRGAQRDQRPRAVDRDRGCVKYIGATADLLGFSEVIRVIPCDVFRFLARPQEPCDVVFADPPYDLPPQQYRALVEAVFSCGLLAEEGILVVEHPKGVDLTDMEGFTQMRRYGTVHFSFFEHGGV